MAVNPDFRDLFAALNAAEARYLVVGAHAVGFHARPRFTKDLDLWVEPAPANVGRVLTALATFGAPLRSLTAADLSDPRTVFQIGVAPNRIDILTALEGLTFAGAWERRVEGRYGDCTIHVLARDDLIRNKRAVGRPQDLEDVRALGGGAG
ncbi:MAG: hypothetical protein ACT4PV_05675 [Planctomycetaceae bacterium]